MQYEFQDNITVLFHLFFSLVVFAVYGVQVCPLLESLSVLQLFVPVFVSLLFVFFAQYKLSPNYSLSECSGKIETGLYWRMIFGLFITASLALSLFNLLAYSAPLESALKVILGLITLGFFVATDLSLQYEKQQALQLKRLSRRLQPNENFMPLTQKFSLFAVANTFFFAVVIFLVINKDLHWLMSTDQRLSLKEAQQVILVEVGFVVVVMLAYTLKIIHSFSHNLSYFFQNENETLQRVASGDLSVRAPVSSHDEFGHIAHNTNLMIDDLARYTQEVKQTRDVAILGLSSLAEARDNETGAHILRTQYYVKALTELLKDRPKYKDYLDDQTIELLYKSAPLHDIGKVGIPDAILLKPGKLTDDEFEIMKTHASIGAEALATAEGQLGSNSFLRFAREISETHHEKWDGSGYPNGLKGEDIPLSGRLMALADVYDALISKRVYKPAFSHEKAKSILIDGKGTHFDPDIVDAFIECEQAFVDIATKYSDKH